jgi:hypothetical protein
LHLFIDFRAACDSIQRDQLFNAMAEFGIPAKLINLNKATLNKVKWGVRIQKNVSEQFVTEKGLGQGDVTCLPPFQHSA